jgi:hypothetical protein
MLKKNFGSATTCNHISITRCSRSCLSHAIQTSTHDTTSEAMSRPAIISIVRCLRSQPQQCDAQSHNFGTNTGTCRIRVRRWHMYNTLQHVFWYGLQIRRAPSMHRHKKDTKWHKLDTLQQIELELVTLGLWYNYRITVRQVRTGSRVRFLELCVKSSKFSCEIKKIWIKFYECLNLVKKN